MVLLSIPFNYLPFALVIPALQCFIHAYWLKLLIDTELLYSKKCYIHLWIEIEGTPIQSWVKIDLWSTKNQPKINQNQPKINQRSTKDQPKINQNQPKNRPKIDQKIQVKKIFGQIYNGNFFNGPK